MRHIWWFSALLLIAGLGLARAAEQPTPSASDIMLGKADAPITVIEYASLTCPHCADFDENTFPEVKKNWIDTGKVKWIFRDFPLNQVAAKASMVAHCAPRSEFFTFLDVLFKNQANWATNDNDQLMKALQRYASLGGISEDKFKSCMADQALYDSILNSQLVAGRDYGVDSTPTFFINGKKVEPPGFMPYDEFEKHLAAAAAAESHGALHVGSAAPTHSSE